MHKVIFKRDKCKIRKINTHFAGMHFRIGAFDFTLKRPVRLAIFEHKTNCDHFHKLNKFDWAPFFFLHSIRLPADLFIESICFPLHSHGVRMKSSVNSLLESERAGTSRRESELRHTKTGWDEKETKKKINRTF